MANLALNEIDDELRAAIRRVAERDGISENEAALKLLRKGVELEDHAPSTGKIGNSLDKFIGTMSQDEADQIDEAIRELRSIDKSVWR